jgi:P4 family phage/plasmid primase-like protien
MKNISKNSLNFQELKINDMFDTSRISKHFKELHGDRFVYVSDQLYYFNNVYWVKDNKKMSYLNNFIGDQYYEYLSKVLNDLTTDNTKVKDASLKATYDAKLLNMRKELSRLLNHRKRKDYIDDIICKITDDDIKFDESPYYFAFKNQIYDLKNNTFIEPDPKHYISYTTGYEYEKPSDKLINELDTFIDTIFPQPDLKHLYLTILSTGLEGLSLEKFVIANGGGGNGKGVLNEFAKDVLGDYCYVMPSNVLLAPLKTGSNPEIANMNNRRLVFCREPDISNKINTATMKELTGGEEINARLNHSNDTKTMLKCTLILECNEKPRLNEVNDAVARRIIDVPFKSTFVDKDIYEKLKDNQKENIFIVNPYYKSKEFKEKYKLAFFHILFNKYKEYIKNGSKLPITDEIRERNKEYLQSSDDIGEWINDEYTKTENDKDRIKLKNIFEYYKSSEVYRNMDKKEQRMMTYKSFQNKLEANIFLKFAIKKNKDNAYELRGYKKESKSEEFMEDEEDVKPINPLDL